MIDYDDYKTSQPSRREPPLSSVKHFDKLERNDLLRPGSRSGTTSEVERDNRRRDGGKKPVSIHQYERDEGYSSQRDDLNDRRGSRSHHERHESKDRSGINSVLAAAGLGVTSVAAAALKDKHDERGNKDKDKDYETDSRRSERDKRQQGRDTEFDMDRRDRRHDKPRSSEQTKEKSDSESGREKRHRRRRHRESVGAEIIDSESSIDKLNAATATAAGTAPVSTMTEEPKERHRHRHRHRRHRSRDHEAKEFRDDGNEMVGSPTDLRNEDSKELRPRKTVTLVEPQKNEAPEVKPKGILKPPRQAFPEDPNPTREGVAPLKDATKKGIPTGARWTKINRILVNPEALEASQERFEERDNYVIVLRVLSREEVQKLADKTREIREAREKVTDRKSDRSEEDDRNRSNRTSRDEDDDSVTDSDYSSSDSYFSDEEVHHPDDHRRNRPQAEEQRTERPLPLEAPPEQYLPSFPPPTSQPEAAFVPVPRPTQMNQLNMPPQHLQQPQQQQ
ncbi:hypothetical protein UCRPC4_g04569 [Phaeomoniella chlamydospora]|uniref:DUF8035 domain-containing protein n=1 Tax=Phaeomoniella chlamydospora TaxID=158046 RepID=A0A0G2GQU6_PHACM|nr:hypothetical protein UCRPC4_g04569 [Phaeomoniella chlamydospora]